MRAAPQDQLAALKEANNNLVRSLTEAQQSRDDFKVGGVWLSGVECIVLRAGGGKSANG